MSLASLELNWVRNVDKSLVVPTVIFEPFTHVGSWKPIRIGWYCVPGAKPATTGGA